MKNLNELQALKEKTENEINSYSTRVLVGMATCGIAAGAKPVIDAFEEVVKNNNLSGDVSVTRVGCIGLCQYEPLVEIIKKGEEPVTYINMDAEKAAKVAEKHLVNGEIVAEYTVSNTSLA
ncbi:MAG: (2Fe-2S) ferredoxin domain-containing protein [Oscillospiraceae bacterium]|nr:(2Fe-2S) ferredoxin domain-containing protein [Oscillospiraceae bacterium]